VVDISGAAEWRRSWVRVLAMAEARQRFLELLSD